MRCHGPSTASNARRRQTVTNSKWRVATAWNCWLPKHHPRGNTTGAGAILRPWCFLAQDGKGIVEGMLNCAIIRTDFPAPEGSRMGFFTLSGSLAEKVKNCARRRVLAGPTNASLVLLWIGMEFFWRSARKPGRLGV